MSVLDSILDSVLIVVATKAEADRLQGLRARVVVSGVGAVAAALATQKELLNGPFDLVVSAGIAGAYPHSGLQPADLACSSRIIQADLGAWDGEQFLDLSVLGLSVSPNAAHAGQFEVWQGAEAYAKQAAAHFGPMLTLNSVTGSSARAEQLERLFAGALTEGMEGAGVALAAYNFAVPVLEVRGISNFVGPRDRQNWQIGAALAQTRRGLEVLLQ